MAEDGIDHLGNLDIAGEALLRILRIDKLCRLTLQPELGYQLISVELGSATRASRARERSRSVVRYDQGFAWNRTPFDSSV